MEEKYKEWCAITKRNGSVLVGKSIIEFFNWIKEQGYYLANNEPEVKKSRFQEKLDKYMEEQNNKLNK